MITLNNLDVLKKRRLNYVPPHFSKFKIDSYSLMNHSLENWISSKLTGRYAISKIPTIDNNSLKFDTVVGFEDSRELTYFILGCPHIRRN
jgi:hypothetical protein